MKKNIESASGSFKSIVPGNFKSLSRALRRHQTQRIKKARQGYWGRRGSVVNTINTINAINAINGMGPMTPRELGIVCATAAVCSCWMCGNNRKFNGKSTVQERRMFQDMS